MNKEDFLKKFYDENTQLDIEVINDILDESLNTDKKILIFGLGYDSNLWFNINHNVYFVEDNEKYIKMNEEKIKNRTIKHNYGNINVLQSLHLDNKNIEKYLFPEKLSLLGKFDIILVDGPLGNSYHDTGRLLPLYWSKKRLSKEGTIIYVDDSNRKLETYCINKYFKDNVVKRFNKRKGTTKIVM